MKFCKMHGLGNDYVYVNLFEEKIGDAASLARLISDRHTGVGSDGLILIKPSDCADVRMEMYNADGSRAQMCGNGIRCVAKYAFEKHLATESNFSIETDAGIKWVNCTTERGCVSLVRVDMGLPSFEPSDLPISIKADRVVDWPLSVDDRSFEITCVGMGNPHVVVFVDNLASVDLCHDGPLIERASVFPERTNVHFACVESRSHIHMITWERGSGVTRACGTGACAVCVAGAMTDRSDRRIKATLPGGDLDLDWASNDHVYMTGPTIEVFTGLWPEAESVSID